MSAAGVVLVSDNLALLCKRIYFWEGIKVSYGGYWSPFAGSIEVGESPKETARRELIEESGIELPIEMFKFKKVIHTDIEFHLFVVELSSIPQVNLCQEHTEQGTFKIELLHTLEPIDEQVVKTIKEFKNRNLQEIV